MIVAMINIPVCNASLFDSVPLVLVSFFIVRDEIVESGRERSRKDHLTLITSSRSYLFNK